MPHGKLSWKSQGINTRILKWIRNWIKGKRAAGHAERATIDLGQKLLVESFMDQSL